MSQQDIKMTVRVERLFLATDNPRHEEVDDEKEAIELICRTETVAELARDVAINGICPSERLMVYIRVFRLSTGYKQYEGSQASN